jgi:cytochrome d ubiquinol oxidase subunit II
VLTFVVAVSVWTPLAQPAIAERWFSWPNLLYFSPVPLLTGIVAWELWRALQLRRERAPFACTVALFLLSYAGLAVSTWPYAVPRALTIWEAASPPATQMFILVGVLVLLPLVLGYTVHTYRVFRGKASAGYD